MLLPTFKQVKDSRVVQVSSCDTGSEEFKSLVNEATDLLLQRGDWPGTVFPVRCMVRDGCIVWPRFVQRVRRINRCNVPLKVGNIWYDYVDREFYHGWRGDLFYFWGGSGDFHHGHRGQGNLVSQGRVCTYNDVPSANPQYIRACIQDPRDVGKTLTLFGIDSNGQPLTHIDPPTGDVYPGFIITLASPYTQTTVTLGRIDAVLKDVTQANVPVYSVDSVNGSLLDLAIYEPGETNPSYAKDRLFAAGHHCCHNPFTVICLVKAAFIPVVVDTDYVFIPSLNAIKKAVQSIKAGEGGDISGQEQFIQSSVNELNHVLDNEEPLETTPVDEGFAGEAQGIGMQSII